MVGGIVIEVAEVKGRPDVLFVDCQDIKYAKDTCAIYVERNANSEKIQIGDLIWWQCGYAMWTPAVNSEIPSSALRCGIDYDIKIPRVGYSGVKHPARS